MKDNLLPADIFIVMNKTILNEYDRKIITMLYQPIIGINATSLYFTLWSYIEKNEILSREWNHHNLMTSMRISLKDIKEAREKLEAIGLIKTYFRKGNVNNYVYEVYSPVTPSEFVNNPILGITLYNNVGDSEYEKIISYFKIPRVSLKEYEDITLKFSDVFESTCYSNYESIDKEIKRVNTNKLEILSKNDLGTIFSFIPDEMLNIKSITKDTKELIYKLGFIYDFDDEVMTELIRESLNDKKTIDKDLLRKNSRKLYEFEHSGKLPTLIYRNQPEYLRKVKGENTKKAKIIYQFEITTPHDFLLSKTLSERLSKRETDLLEYLLVDMNLRPGVVNVLIDYVLKINNNKLTRNYVEAIASQWALSKVETVEAAMKLAEKEFKKKKSSVYKNVEEKPEWFDKEIKSNIATAEEIREMEELLKEFR